MTRIVSPGILRIEAEPDAPCTLCGKLAELRPYGPGGARICYACAMGTPEMRAEAERRLKARFATAEVNVSPEIAHRMADRAEAATPEQRACDDCMKSLIDGGAPCPRHP